MTETLGIDRFGVVGWSGGAPYAAAVAAALPDRLTGVCLANSASITYAVGPTVTDDEDAHIVEMIDLLGPIEATRRYAEEQRAWAEGCVQDSPSLIDPGEMPEGDRWLFDEPELVAGFLRSMVEGLRQGAIGEATHAIGLLSPWGFSLDEDPAGGPFVARGAGPIGRPARFRACRDANPGPHPDRVAGCRPFRPGQALGQRARGRSRLTDGSPEAVVSPG